MIKMMLSGFFVVSMAGAILGQELPVDLPAGLKDVDPEWIRGNLSAVDDQLAQLTAAYSLDEATQQLVRQEMLNRLVAQYAYEQENWPALKRLTEALEAVGGDENSPEAQALEQRFSTFVAGMPLGEENVVAWVDTQLPQDVVVLGRQRWEELRGREMAVQIAEDDDNHRLAGGKTEIIADMKAKDAPQTPAGNPVPHGPKSQPVLEQNKRIEEAKVVEPNRAVPPPQAGKAPPPAQAGQMPPPAVGGASAAKPVDPNRATPKPGEIIEKAGPAVARVEPGKPGAAPGTPPGRPAVAPAKVEPAPLAVAPPLDDWDKHVAQTAERFQFTEAQVTTARSILKDLRRRAYQYQMSRSADFARAHLINDAKARQAELARLSKPIDALFSELKVRLDSLLTAEQRRLAEKDGKGAAKPAAKPAVQKPPPPPARPATPAPSKPPVKSPPT